MKRLQYLLTKLAEEAMEVGQISLKAQQFGLNEKREGQDLTNKERIHAELNDLNGIIRLLNCEFGFNYDSGELDSLVAQADKMERVEKWYKYSRSLGNVE